MKPLSVVIVNYNSTSLLEQCLLSIREESDLDQLHVVVVDNASTDGNLAELRQLFQWVSFLQNDTNVGFAVACNRGLFSQSAQNYLLLNPDTVVQGRAIEKTLDFLERTSDAGIVGCRVLNPDGSLQRGSRRSIPTLTNSLLQLTGFARWLPRRSGFKHYDLRHLDPKQTHPVEAVSGSFLMFRGKLLSQTSGLDERFFLYGEDLDFCLQSLQHGWTNYYFAGAQVLHRKGQSSQTQVRHSTRHFYAAMRTFYDKHYGPGQAFPVRVLVHAGIALLYNATRLRQRLFSSHRIGRRG